MAILKAVYDILGQFVNQPAPTQPAGGGVAFAPFGGGLWLKLLPIVAKILAELAATAPTA